MYCVSYAIFNVAKVSNTDEISHIQCEMVQISEAGKKWKGKKHTFIHSKSKQCPVCLRGTAYNVHAHYTNSVIHG